MIKEQSYGIIPFLGKKVLLIRHEAGHWSFPKGHAEKGETPEQTAQRELKEEVNLSITSFLPYPPFSESYFFKKKDQLIEKKVTYFLAQVEGELQIQEEEIIDARWLTLEEAYLLATFPELKKLISKIKELLL